MNLKHISVFLITFFMVICSPCIFAENVNTGDLNLADAVVNDSTDGGDMIVDNVCVNDSADGGNVIVDDAGVDNVGVNNFDDVFNNMTPKIAEPVKKDNSNKLPWTNEIW